MFLLLLNLLGWQWLTKWHRFHAHNSTTHPTYTVLYAHHPESSLHLLPFLPREFEWTGRVGWRDWAKRKKKKKKTHGHDIRGRREYLFFYVKIKNIAKLMAFCCVSRYQIYIYICVPIISIWKKCEVFSYKYKLLSTKQNIPLM